MRTAFGLALCLTAYACNGGGHGPPSAQPPAPDRSEAHPGEPAPGESQAAHRPADPDASEFEPAEPGAEEGERAGAASTESDEDEGPGATTAPRAPLEPVPESDVTPEPRESSIETADIDPRADGGARTSGSGDADSDDAGAEGGEGSRRTAVAEVACDEAPLPERMQVEFEVGHSARDLATWYVETTCEPVMMPRAALGRTARARVDGLVGREQVRTFLDSLAGDVGLAVRDAGEGIALVDIASDADDGRAAEFVQFAPEGEGARAPDETEGGDADGDDGGGDGEGGEFEEGEGGREPTEAEGGRPGSGDGSGDGEAARATGHAYSVLAVRGAEHRRPEGARGLAKEQVCAGGRG